MSDKPTGLTADDFLPNKFGKMSVSNSSPFGWPQTELSELDVTSSILRGHSNMMTVLTARSRHITIIRQMWTGKDAKTAAEHAVSCNDESVIVENQGTIFLGGPPLVKAATGVEVSSEELGGGEVHAKISGVVDHLARDDSHALEIARNIISGTDIQTTKTGSILEEIRLLDEVIVNSTTIKGVFDPEIVGYFNVE